MVGTPYIALFKESNELKYRLSPGLRHFRRGTALLLPTRLRAFLASRSGETCLLDLENHTLSICPFSDHKACPTWKNGQCRPGNPKRMNHLSLRTVRRCRPRPFLSQWQSLNEEEATSRRQRANPHRGHIAAIGHSGSNRLLQLQIGPETTTLTIH